MEPASSLSPGLKIPPAPREKQSGPRVTARRISPLCSKYHAPYHTHSTKNPRWRVSKIQLTRTYALSPSASPTRPPGHSPTSYNPLTIPRSKAPRSPTALAQLPNPAPGHLQPPIQAGDLAHNSGPNSLFSRQASNLRAYNPAPPLHWLRNISITILTSTLCGLQ